LYVNKEADGELWYYVETRSKPKRKYRRKPPVPTEKRQSARLELKRRETQQSLLTLKLSSDDDSSSDNSDNHSTLLPRRAWWRSPPTEQRQTEDLSANFSEQTNMMSSAAVQQV